MIESLDEFDIQGERPELQPDNLPIFIHVDDSPHREGGGGIDRVVKNFLEIERNLHLPEVLVNKEMEAYAYFRNHGRGIMLVAAGTVVAGATISFTWYMRKLYRERKQKKTVYVKPSAS